MKYSCNSQHRLEIKIEISHWNKKYGGAEPADGSNYLSNQSQKDKHKTQVAHASYSKCEGV